MKIVGGKVAKFVKNDRGKSRLDLVPPRALMLVGHVFGAGAQLYDDENWRLCKTPGRFTGAAFRHLLAHRSGQFLDKTGLPHLAHLACNALIELELRLLDNGGVRGNYFAVVRRSGRSWIIAKRFRDFETAWEYRVSLPDSDKHTVRTVAATDKVGSRIRG